MGTPFRRARPSRADRLRANDAATRFYAAAADKEAPAHLLNNLPPKRDRVLRPVDKRPVVPYERDVLANAIRALRNDPRVWFCERVQSGLFQDGNRYIRVGVPGKLDVQGMTVSGRYFEFEAKRPGEKPDPRQDKRISFIRQGGGLSGYFTSAEDALALLP